MSSTERASLGCSNMRKWRKWEVGPLDWRSIWIKNWSPWGEWERNSNEEGGGGRWSFLPEPGLIVWEGQLQPPGTRWLLTTSEVSMERYTSGMEQWMQRTAEVINGTGLMSHVKGQSAGRHVGEGLTELGTQNNCWIHLVAPSQIQAHRRLNTSGSIFTARKQPEL